MRKYFLLSALALMTATNVNAAEGAATIQVEAKLIEPTIIDCTALNFGTLKVKRGSANANFTMSTAGEISVDAPSNGWVLIQSQGAQAGNCTLNETPITMAGFASGKAYLNDEETIYADMFEIENGVLTARLTILKDAEITGEQLSGSTTISFTYE